jgi:hypothetical protein
MKLQTYRFMFGARMWSIALLVLTCVSVAGCARRSADVGGLVTLDGQPLKGASVTFLLSTAPPGRSEGLFVGVTDEQGRYSLHPASPKGSVMLPGKYLVSFSTTYVEGGTPDFEPPPPERVPPKYRKGIEFEVPGGGTSDANFDLTTK